MRLLFQIRLLYKRLKMCRVVLKEWYPWDYASMLVLMKEHLNHAIVDQIQAQHVGNEKIACNMIAVRDALAQLIEDEYEGAYKARQEYDWAKEALWEKYPDSPRDFMQFLPEPIETHAELPDGGTLVSTDYKHPDYIALDKLRKKWWSVEIKARKKCFETVANAFVKEDIRSWWS